MKAVDLRARILAAVDRKSLPVEVPEWGEKDKPLRLYIAEMTGEERDQFEAWLLSTEATRKPFDLLTRVLEVTLRDEDGDRIFDAATAPQLMSRSFAVLDRLYDLAWEHNRLGGKSKDDAAGKSKPAPGGSSS